jgi:hypothetical protein
MDEQDKPEGGGDQARRVARRKKRRRRAVAAEEPVSPRPARKRSVVEAEPKSEWTRNHVIVALVAGLGIGGIAGYFGGKGGVGGAAKDASGRPVGADGRPVADGARVHVPLGSWSPRKGPEHAKVTILDFSDFQ